MKNSELLINIDKNMAVMMSEQRVIKSDIISIKCDVGEVKKKQAEHDIILTKGSGKIKANYEKINNNQIKVDEHIKEYRDTNKDKTTMGFRRSEIILATISVIIAVIALTISL